MPQKVNKESRESSEERNKTGSPVRSAWNPWNTGASMERGKRMLNRNEKEQLKQIKE